jgi:hypothetical protein
MNPAPPVTRIFIRVSLVCVKMIAIGLILA